MVLMTHVFSPSVRRIHTAVIRPSKYINEDI